MTCRMPWMLWGTEWGLCLWACLWTSLLHCVLKIQAVKEFKLYSIAFANECIQSRGIYWCVHNCGALGVDVCCRVACCQAFWPTEFKHISRWRNINLTGVCSNCEWTVPVASGLLDAGQALQNWNTLLIDACSGVFWGRATEKVKFLC